jgi:hypothetical protein
VEKMPHIQTGSGGNEEGLAWEDPTFSRCPERGSISSRPNSIDVALTR